MLKKIFLIGFPILAWGFAPMRLSAYQLEFEGEAGPLAKEHFISLQDGPNKKIQGILQLDRRTYPEARIPDPDRQLYIIDFEPKEVPHAIQFAITVGILSPTTYAFQLHQCPEAGYPRCTPENDYLWLQGSVAITSATESKQIGVRGRLTHQPPAFPKWSDLPRGDF